MTHRLPAVDIGESGIRLWQDPEVGNRCIHAYQ